MENDFAYGLCPVKTSMNNALPKDINCIRFLSLFLFESLEVLEDEKSPRRAPWTKWFLIGIINYHSI